MVLKIIITDLLKKLSLKIWDSFSFLQFLTMFFEKYSCQTCHTLFCRGQDRQEIFVPVEVTVAAQIVPTFDPHGNLSLQLYETQNKNYNFGTTKTLILKARSIFFKNME